MKYKARYTYYTRTEREWGKRYIDKNWSKQAIHSYVFSVDAIFSQQSEFYFDISNLISWNTGQMIKRKMFTFDINGQNSWIQWELNQTRVQIYSVHFFVDHFLF